MEELIFQKGLMLIKQICQKIDISHCWYFKDPGFMYKPYRCNGCHDLMQKAMSFKGALNKFDYILKIS